ncbi:hypothetical protein OEZ60_11885 [Defluviimonas sp. WL0024]|uniref:DUF7742 domain-containing protein n=2 Tax=Albidovulum TaxID=205889 RepID=A0ABT3J434_9RHOB|nr:MULTISPECIES: hypothetical protein [Defluviimonas]MCU9848705.1 hypothetical protein [Defluviimonas sp. WL0024]MCW3782230.1 hypothetical protein [Defluviimonas salinarum]
MRTLTHGDVAAAARAVLHLPREEWPGAVWRFLECAHAADLFRKRHGRNHPLWGNGSLSAATPPNARLAPEPFLSELRYLEAMASVFDVLLDWRRREV